MTTKRALVCGPLIPEFDRESGSKRIFDLVQYLCEDGWSVSFYAEHAQPGSERYSRALRQHGVAVYAGTSSLWAGDEYTPDPKRLIANGQFDLALLEFWYTGEQLIPLIRELSPHTCVIVDSLDLQFVRTARRDLHGHGPTARRLADSFGEEIRREINAYAMADAVLTVSGHEADLLNALTGNPTLAHVVPDAEDLTRSTVPPGERRGILSLGNFRHPPNAEAVAYLCQEILPLVNPALLATHPVYIVGNDLNESVRRHGKDLEHVRMIGWVPAVEPYLEQARISVVPLLYGAGTKRKLVQALMTGTPSVSTTIGSEGLELIHEEHVLIADEPAAFARAIERLLTDDALWQRLADQGHFHVTPRHSQTAARAALTRVIGQTMEAARRLEPDPVASPVLLATAPAFPDGHFYSPVVDANDVNVRQHRIWPVEPVVLGIDFNESGQREFLMTQFSKYIADFDYSEQRPPGAQAYDYYTMNSEFGWLDARALFVTLRSLRPKRMIEIGSGYSSLLTADVNRRFLDSSLEFTCIEPYPRPFLLAGVPGITSLLQRKVQDVPVDYFGGLNADDILFVDSSHVAKTGSDVNYILFEILPRLAPGVIIHFHDIFLPHDYPKGWVLGEGRSWNEQYLVQSLLMQPSGYEVMFGSAFAHHHLQKLLTELLGRLAFGGGSLWVRKL